MRNKNIKKYIKSGEIPDSQTLPDNIPMPYYSTEKGSYYEYEDAPLRPEDEVKRRREIVDTLLIQSLNI